MEAERAHRGRRHEGLFVLAVLLALAFVARQVGIGLAPEVPDAPPPDGSPTSTPVDASAPAGEAAVLEAFRSRRSDVAVEVAGVVERLLDDDEEGSRHQRFVVELPGGHTLLVAHNIDLAARVPLERGDDVTLRGEYEWNDRGGVVHWTHRDPAGRHPGGWVRHRGKTYE